MKVLHDNCLVRRLAEDPNRVSVVLLFPERSEGRSVEPHFVELLECGDGRIARDGNRVPTLLSLPGLRLGCKMLALLRFSPPVTDDYTGQYGTCLVQDFDVLAYVPEGGRDLLPVWGRVILESETSPVRRTGGKLVVFTAPAKHAEVAHDVGRVVATAPVLREETVPGNSAHGWSSRLTDTFWGSAECPVEVGERVLYTRSSIYEINGTPGLKRVIVNTRSILAKVREGVCVL